MLQSLLKDIGSKVHLGLCPNIIDQTSKHSWHTGSVVCWRPVSSANPERIAYLTLSLMVDTFPSWGQLFTCPAVIYSTILSKDTTSSSSAVTLLPSTYWSSRRKFDTFTSHKHLNEVFMSLDNNLETHIYHKLFHQPITTSFNIADSFEKPSFLD